ncbi:hypothetical protein FRC01_005322 [Tulasnella sp. 417]|nr:hypothetical protein FRC01_005322 [Tulasnella sp. 417]
MMPWELEEFTLMRPLQKSDRDRFTLHSQHIKRFFFSVDAASWQFFQQLAPHFPSTPILPNLAFAMVHIVDPPQPDLELARLFLSLTVTELEFQVDLDAEEEPSGYQWILEPLAGEMKLPNLTSFRISAGYTLVTDAGPNVSRILQSHQGIEKLEIVLSRSHTVLEILRSAAELPHLRRFKMNHPDGEAAQREPKILSLPLDGLFPSLESLELSSAPDCLSSILGRVSSKNVRNIRLTMIGQGPPEVFEEFEAAGDTSIADCFRTIRGFVHLKALEVALRVRTTWDTFQCLLGCKELEALKILGGCGYDIKLEESHLEQMGRAWRDLKTLYLHPTSFTNQEMCLTFAHLQVIATEFPNLRKLVIACDARVASNTGFSVDRAVAAQNSLQELDVNESLIDERGEKVVGRLLAVWWPNLVEVTWASGANWAWRWAAVYGNYRSNIS